ncbi:MAG: hypothetical protein HC915_03030 [Anaerolineae bacterium]|nr:hypothetical protein [Anaerolineae bacterium]
MNPEDRVLVGVINRRQDLTHAEQDHWYRIPEGQAQPGLYAEYLAFFLSRAFKERNGGVYFFARRRGEELVTRADLLPDEADHPRAQARYYKIQLDPLQPKDPPILNPNKRRFAFVYTTWDRFINATRIDDLFSRADHLVDRVYYALRDEGYRPQRSWERGDLYPLHSPRLRLLCEEGEVTASPHSEQSQVQIHEDLGATLSEIRAAVAERGGLRMLTIPAEA